MITREVNLVYSTSVRKKNPFKYINCSIRDIYVCLSKEFDIVIRKLDSLSKLKKNTLRLNTQSNNNSVPKHYYYGSRKLNGIL